MRIISGSARGTKLFTLEGNNTRPTLDRVKEPLFNIINFKLKDAIILDLFAGSGALGLEAISRGSRKAIFCEKSRNAASIIRKNIEKTHFENKSELFIEDFEKVLNRLENDNVKIDIIFLDPPYNTDYIYKSLLLILNKNIIADDGIIIVETDELERIKEEIRDLDIEIYDIRKYGRACLLFIKRQKS